jgi:hypothetical protein
VLVLLADRAATRQLAGCLAPDSLALTLQNSASNRETLARVLSPERGPGADGQATLLWQTSRPAGEGPIVDSPRVDPLAGCCARRAFR